MGIYIIYITSGSVTVINIRSERNVPFDECRKKSTHYLNSVSKYIKKTIYNGYYLYTIRGID